MRAASFVTRRLQAAHRAAAAKRGMASHSHGHGKDYPFGMHFHVSPVHKNLALAYGTMLWLWVFYRAKEDGRVVLVRSTCVSVYVLCTHEVLVYPRSTLASSLVSWSVVPVVSFAVSTTTVDSRLTNLWTDRLVSLSIY